MPDRDQHSTRQDALLEELARLYGLQTEYRDSRGERCVSPPGSIIRVLAALGGDLEELMGGGLHEFPRGSGRAEEILIAALAARRRELGRRVLEPVLVAWGGVLPSVVIRPQGDVHSLSPVRPGRTGARLTLLREDGVEQSLELDLDSLPISSQEIESGPVARLLPSRTWGSGAGKMGGAPHETIAAPLPLGYHRLRLETGSTCTESLLISAPQRCWTPSDLDPEAGISGTGLSAGSCRSGGWGMFVPVYALRSSRDWGAGDFADLHDVCRWVGEAGGSVVSTLPLLANYLDIPFEPAPYRPVSRLFWNEFYLAVDRLAELSSCQGAIDTWLSDDVQTRIARLRAGSLVEYKEVMAVKRRVLEELAECFFSTDHADRRAGFQAYLAAHPEAEAYASFRNEVEVRGADWRDWPEAASQRVRSRLFVDRSAVAGDLSPTQRYHLYCQWQAEEQLTAIARSRSAARLALDLPAGVHPGGYDTWRWPHLFAHELSTGAPPDAFFSLGQNWDFAPLHPDRAREDGHGYFAACLRHDMRLAGQVRVDHVMGLHRLFVIPSGAKPPEGVYVTYPAEELYAILTLESNRCRTAVVGEDLGTVPPGVRASMARHGLRRTWVLQASLRPRAATVVDPPPRHSVSSINTHDMYPFAGFLLGRDIDARVETGQLAPEDAPREREGRRKLVQRLEDFLKATASEGEIGRGPVSPAELLRLALKHVAAGKSSLLLINLEDLLLETRPQNLPGTGPERPNWRRKSAASEAEVKRVIELVAEWLRSQDP
ncbi:MAG: 4-alpha-glucanotransferase [Thermoleophilia bacterium]|jgi:4-alpha-glucanotransferase